MILRLLTVAAAAMLPAFLSLQQKPIDQLAFMQGCWQMQRNTRVVDEHWSAPRAGTMFGFSRTVVADSVREHEFIRIYTRGDKLVYAAQPSRQAPAEFESTTLNDNEVVFANPQHDFPQRIIYRRLGNDSLIARVEGTMNGGERGFDFRYGRQACSQRH
jgi:hypothetical protein